MHERGESRPQKEQAEVKQCGPYSSIVLAVLEIKRKEKAAGAALRSRIGRPGSSRGISAGTRRQ
jgi:hypothetical protein